MEKEIYNYLCEGLNFREKIICFIFKKYTFEIYKKGYDDGFNFCMEK